MHSVLEPPTIVGELSIRDEIRDVVTVNEVVCVEAPSVAVRVTGTSELTGVVDIEKGAES